MTRNAIFYVGWESKLRQASLLKLKAFALDRDGLEGEILLDAGGTIGLAVAGLLVEAKGLCSGSRRS